jgi:branched-chain amino acid transport system substrate-binding protein
VAKPTKDVGKEDAMIRVGCWSTRLAALSIGALLAMFSLTAIARAADPIRIGFGIGLTGGVAANGKAALIAFQMWAEEVNAKGGLLGRKVEFIYYDDQSNPSTVPGIYTKLLDIDKVDLVVSGYGTNLVAPAMPIVMQRGLLFIGLFAYALNENFKYPNYFTMFPAGPNPKVDFAQSFFELAVSQSPKPRTLAIVAMDGEFSLLSAEGAREHAKRHGLRIVYDRTYPPATVDFTPIVRAVQATNPDVVFAATYPPDGANMVRAVSEVGLKTNLFGGSMAGLQFAAFKTQLGPALNGVVNYEFYVPEPTLKFPGIEVFLKKYQVKAVEAKVDPLGFYLPPFAYAEMQILGQAIEGTKSVDQKNLADYIRTSTFATVLGDVKFAPNGEWTQSRVLQVQYQGIKGNDLEQFKKAGTQVVVWPRELKSGELKYPLQDARQ